MARKTDHILLNTHVCLHVYKQTHTNTAGHQGCLNGEHVKRREIPRMKGGGVVRTHASSFSSKSDPLKDSISPYFTVILNVPLIKGKGKCYREKLRVKTKHSSSSHWLEAGADGQPKGPTVFRAYI